MGLIRVRRACGGESPLSHGRSLRSRPRTARIALPVVSPNVSFWASQMITLGWFHRSRIHSPYSRASSSLVHSGGNLSQYQTGNSSWIIRPVSSAMSYHFSGGKPMQYRAALKCIQRNALCNLRAHSSLQGRSPRSGSSKNRKMQRFVPRSQHVLPLSVGSLVFGSNPNVLMPKRSEHWSAPASTSRRYCQEQTVAVIVVH